MYIVDDEEEGEICSVYDLIYEKLEEIFVFVCKKDYLDACETLEKIGLRQQIDYRVIHRPKYTNVFHKSLLDVNIGYTKFVGEIDIEYPGITVFKDDKVKEEEALRIVTLGGSTSDSQLSLRKCWSQILYDKLRETNKNIILYSAGTAGYYSAHELIKLERDLLTLEPDIVISFSGVNDIFENPYPFVHFYAATIFDKFTNASLSDLFGGKVIQKYTRGVKRRTSSAYNWIKHQRMMKAICEEFGVEFYSFLQPMLGGKNENLSTKEKEIMIHDLGNVSELSQKFLSEAKNIIKVEKLDYISDISNLFDGIGNVYIDDCHVTEEGNYIIANKIYEILEKRKACIF